MTTYEEVMNSSRTHFAERRRRARNAAPAPAPAATSYFGLDFGIYDLFCCAPQQPDPAAAQFNAPGDVETVLEVDVSPRRPARTIDIVATPDEEELVWERLAPPTRDDTRRPHEVSMDVDDAPSPRCRRRRHPPRPRDRGRRRASRAARRARLRPRRAQPTKTPQQRDATR